MQREHAAALKRPIEQQREITCHRRRARQSRRRVTQPRSIGGIEIEPPPGDIDHDRLPQSRLGGGGAQGRRPTHNLEPSSGSGYGVGLARTDS